MLFQNSRRPFIFLGVSLLCLVLLPVAFAFRGGDSGSLKNDGNVSVKVKVEESSGDFRWVRLDENASFDLPPATARVSLHEDRSSRDVRDPRMRVLLWHPSGERMTLETYGQKIDIIPDRASAIFPDPRSGSKRGGSIYDERD